MVMEIDGMENFEESQLDILMNTYHLSNLSVNIIVNIAGWAVNKMIKKEKCKYCINALLDHGELPPDYTKLVRLNMNKEKKYCIAAKDVVVLCIECENTFRKAAYKSDSTESQYRYSHPYDILSTSQLYNTMYKVLASSQKLMLFHNLKDHMQGHKPPHNHVVYFHREIIINYLRCRYFYAQNEFNNHLKYTAGNSTRHQSHRAPIWAGK